MSVPARNRNDPCPCGSGQRYKHCHGRVDAATAPAGSAAPAARAAGEAHAAGALARAEALYRQALADAPEDAQLLHMLGVVLFERARYAEAHAVLWEAAEADRWRDADIRHNLGLVVAKRMSVAVNARQSALVDAYVALVRARQAAAPRHASVSVVLPVVEATDVGPTLASIAAQTYADVEIVVVDARAARRDDDDLARALAATARAWRLESAFGATFAQAANRGAGVARGDYLAFVEAGDRFAPARVERMVAEIARDEPLWGFSRAIGSAGTPGAPVKSLDHAIGSFALHEGDPLCGEGNLFVARALFEAHAGFDAGVARPGRELALRLAQRVEPVVVDAPLYACRAASRRESSMAAVLPPASDPGVVNPFSPQHAANADLVMRQALRAGNGEHLPVATLRALAERWRGAAPPSTRGVVKAAGAARTAIVVLGAYRSGTSALARVLNLCGAALPEAVMPPVPGFNPTGFWEPEAVNDLDARLLNRLGGDWNRVDFDLPREGELVDEFVADAAAIVEREYAGAPLVVIKDPRISVLAPLWQRALARAGYRAAYVVAVRNPLEVARSIETRGDLTIAAGLTLWLAYARRVEAFVDVCAAPVVHVRYAELLLDWRRVVARIAGRLDVPLAADPHAGAIDAFLAAGRRNQHADDAELAAHLAGVDGVAIRALYARQLALCAHDAAALRESA
jgi:tetratricopeptide (TPR) repeat protein